MQFTLTLDLAVTSVSPLKPFAEKGIDEELPDIHPMHHNISLRKENIYENKDLYRKYLFEELKIFRNLQCTELRQIGVCFLSETKTLEDEKSYKLKSISFLFLLDSTTTVQNF